MWNRKRAIVSGARRKSAPLHVPWVEVNAVAGSAAVVV
jgi:hypothetical protein